MSIVGLLELLMPPACAACGRSGALLCRKCLDGFSTPSKPADRFLSADGGVVVGESLWLAAAAFAYQGPMRRALAALKYTGASRLAPTLARAALPALRTLELVTGPASLVPVPLGGALQGASGWGIRTVIARAAAALALVGTA